MSVELGQMPHPPTLPSTSSEPPCPPPDPRTRAYAVAVIRRSTGAALALSFVALTWVVADRTGHLRHIASLSPTIRVRWAGWFVAVFFAYVGWSLIASWAIRRDRRGICQVK